MHARTRVTRLALIAGLAAGLVLPASALGTNGCPPRFELTYAPLPPGDAVFWFDRNGDGWLCYRLTGAGAMYMDNNVPEDVADGITDRGEPVLVDTETGGLVGA